MTIGDVVDFVESVPRGRAFPNCTKTDILGLIKEGLEDCGLIVFTNKDKPIGILLLKAYEQQKSVWVKNILCHPSCCSECMKKAFEIYKQRFNGWKLLVQRHDKFRTITPSERLINFFIGE